MISQNYPKVNAFKTVLLYNSYTETTARPTLFFIKKQRITKHLFYAKIPQTCYTKTKQNKTKKEED